VGAGPAGAEVPDAKCEGTPFSPMGDHRVGQPFTALNTGQLVRFEAFFNDPPPGVSSTWTVQINTVDGTDKPTNTTLATTVVPLVGSGSNTAQPIGGTFPNPAQVVAGQRYAIAIANSLAPSGDNAPLAGPDLCSGHVYGDDSLSGSWPFQYTTVDLVFATFVEPAQPAPQPQPVPKADGTLTIDANKGKVEKGRKVTLTGQLDVASNESCEPGRQIEIQRRLKPEDDSKFAPFTTVQTDATGNYSTKIKVKKTYFYRAVVSENDACDDETSNSQKVRVQKKKAAQEA